MRWLKFLIFLLPLSASAQVDLNSTRPAPQVKGIVQSINGGLGLDSHTLTGCPRVDVGVWSVSPANCPASAPFSILSFTGCNGTVELGFHVVNPTCSATYSATPSSANITNTDGISSPTNLISPFTSQTITGNFSHTAIATNTFTLTAIGTSTQTANQAYQWQPRIFGGLGSTGATSTVTASGTNAILSTGNTIGTLQLGAESIGSVFGPFAPSGQNVYLLLIGGSHTFVDVGTGFPFAFNSPTAVSFTNVNGVVVSMFLYRSTNSLTGTFNIRIAS